MANALVAPNSRLPVANQDGSATNAWYQFFSQIPSQISSTIDVSAASYTDHPALDTIWTRGPVPNPPTVQSGLTLGDKFKAMGVFNFAEVWPFDAFYDCYAQLQAYALYCQLMALAMKSDQLENLLERSFVDLYLPRGRFYISQPLVVPELVRITGPGVIVRAPYVGAQSGGSLTPGTFYAVSSTTSGMYYPLVIITPRAHIGQLNLYTNGGTGSLYFRGSGVAIGKFWAADPGGAVTIGQAGSGYNVGDFIYSPSPQASPYAPCYIQVTSVNGGGGVTGASV
jgi:hypothetical protein